MGAAQFESDVSFEKSEYAAAAMLCRTRYGNLHAGLLYKRKYEAKVLHVGWTDKLMDRWAEDHQSREWVRFWAAPQVEPRRLFAISAFCARIRKKFQQTKSMPYGIAFHQSRFRDNGALQNDNPAVVGVSCSTFILAVFNTVGVMLVDEDSWPVRKEDDIKWYKSLPQKLKDDAPFLEGEIEAGVRRIRPEEVLGACACEVPAHFDVCRAYSEQSVTVLDEHQAANSP